jgi:hypothetical protein
MNPSEKRFENELRRLIPADTSGALRSALAVELNVAVAHASVVPRGRLRSIWFAWSIAGVSVCLAAVLVFRDAFRARQSVSPPQVQSANVLNADSSDDLRMVPVDSSGILLVALDEGIVYLESGQPVRKLRLQYVDTVRLRDTAATAAIEITTPREEVRLLPIDTL